MRKTDLLTTAQAAEIFGVSVATVNRWVAAGRITPAVQFPGTTGGRLYDRADVDKLAKRRALAGDAA